MAKTVKFYFDVISPFSYLAHVKLPDLAKRYGYELDYRPMDIPTAKVAAGNYGPSNREIPPKIKVLAADLQRWAKHYDVPLAFPKGFDGLRWNIGALYARDHGQAEAYVSAAYHQVWVEGIDPADEDRLRAVVDGLGFDVEEFFEYVHSSKGETDFRKSCTEAHQAGIFGAPMMVVDDQIFWGNDRLMFLEAYLADHAA